MQATARLESVVSLRGLYPNFKTEDSEMKNEPNDELNHYAFATYGMLTNSASRAGGMPKVSRIGNWGR